MSHLLVTVLSKPNCVQCTFTIKELDTQGIPHVVLDITTDDAAREKAFSLGYMQAPVVIVEQGESMESWSGFSPDRIRAIKTFLIENKEN